MGYKGLPKIKDVHESSEKKLFNVVSLFAGAGGSSTGYRLAGGNILAINEFVSHARKIYSQNYPSTHIFHEDIRDLDSEDILNKINLKKGELDLLDGSPPCASFSISGNREADWGKIKNYSNTTQRTDDLFLEFARILKGLQPKVFVAENVKGLMVGKAKIMCDFFKEKLQDCGYKVEVQVLNSANFGVPQTRERVFFIGVRNDLGMKPVFPKPFDYKVSTKDAIIDLINNGTDDTSSTESKRYILMRKYFPAGTNNKLIKEIKKIYDGVIYEKNYRRDKWQEPFYTLTQNHYRPFHPQVDRTLSVDEAKRIQSFPDDFIFPLSPNKNWEFVGRAVPPLLMKAIAENLYNEVISKIK